MTAPQLLKDWGITCVGAVMAATAAFGDIANDAYAGEPATISTETPEKVSPIDAMSMSANKVVFHYGEGIYDIDDAVHVVKNIEGIDTIALPGGPNGAVALLVDGKSSGIFTQEEVLSGVLTFTATQKWKMENASPRKDAENVATTGQSTGKHVILRPGTNYNPVSAKIVGINLPEQCSYEIINYGISDNELMVEVGDKFDFFERTGVAGNTAARWCLEGNEPDAPSNE